MPKFSPVETARGWMVSVPPTMASSGRRERRYFADEKKAKEYAGQIRAQWSKGLRGGILDANTAAEAKQALELLRPMGMGLLDAARLVLRQASEAGTGSAETLRERWLAYCGRMEPHWRTRYAHDMGKVPRWVGPELMRARVCEVTPERLAAALRAHGAASESTLKMRSDRVNAVLKNRGSRKRSHNIAIMTVYQCARMLRSAETLAQRQAVALLLFAGVRPSAEDGEITRLEWDAVGEDDIYISPEVAKTGSDRHIPLTPRLRRLLRGRPHEGAVMPPGWKKAWQRLRKAAGVTQQDITRHTFASNFLAAYGEQAAKSAMGHAAGSDTLLRHYRRAVLEKAGKRFFR